MSPSPARVSVSPGHEFSYCLGRQEMRAACMRYWPPSRLSHQHFFSCSKLPPHLQGQCTSSITLSTSASTSHICTLAHQLLHSHCPRCRAGDHGRGSQARQGSLTNKSVTSSPSCRTSSPRLASGAMIECHLQGCCRRPAATLGACTGRSTT
ncbi:hypothetical protein BRADI_1g73161v3 [Brachypodium distachyon]|uniref:Uncharacterized protein n=1 Tax=Brachypodium distachyon TaxID=15368 RepID=A0A2K2DUX6_BRADI|nr:hypothetical protein BRADI_1g73161v3 [Brachypodium distachyon]